MFGYYMPEVTFEMNNFFTEEEWRKINNCHFHTSSKERKGLIWWLCYDQSYKKNILLYILDQDIRKEAYGLNTHGVYSINIDDFVNLQEALKLFNIYL